MKTKRKIILTLTLCISSLGSPYLLELIVNIYYSYFYTGANGIVLGHSPELELYLMFDVTAKIISGISFLVFLSYLIKYFGEKIEKTGKQNLEVN